MIEIFIFFAYTPTLTPRCAPPTTTPRRAPPTTRPRRAPPTTTPHRAPPTRKPHRASPTNAFHFKGNSLFVIKCLGMMFFLTLVEWNAYITANSTLMPP